MSAEHSSRLNLDVLFARVPGEPKYGQQSFGTTEPNRLAQGDLWSARLAVSDQYTLLRGAIAQLAGALLIYRNSARFEPDAIARIADDGRRRVKRSREILRSKDGAARAGIVLACLSAAALLENATSIILDSLHAAGGGLARAEQAFDPLRRAYLMLAGAASDRDGCTMIAFDGCCCCPPTRLRRT